MCVTRIHIAHNMFKRHIRTNVPPAPPQLDIVHALNIIQSHDISSHSEDSVEIYEGKIKLLK